MQRTHQLAERGLVSRSQLEQADLAFTTASRALEAARQAERAAQHDVAVVRAALLQLRGEVAGAEAHKLWHIVSPIQGHVLRVLQESTGVVAAGTPRVVEPGAFTKVSALGVEEQRVNVVIDLISPFTQWQTLGDNYRIDARILVYSRDHVLKVPTSALFREHQQWMVFVVNDGRAEKRAVQRGRRNAVEAIVESGLVENDQVILYPSDAVYDGVRVKRV
jgi:HlyD family secretion protein